MMLSEMETKDNSTTVGRGAPLGQDVIWIAKPGEGLVLVVRLMMKRCRQCYGGNDDCCSQNMSITYHEKQRDEDSS